MKTFTKSIATLLILITINLITINLSAQTPPPPNGGENPTDPGSGNTPVGGGAPVGSGVVILIAIGAAYGIKKMQE